MPKRDLMREQWGVFCERVIQVDAPEVQKIEMRRAFYAGGQAIMFRVIAAFSPGDEVTEPDIQVIADLKDELNRFAEDVKMGLA